MPWIETKTAARTRQSAGLVDPKDGSRHSLGDSSRALTMMFETSVLERTNISTPLKSQVTFVARVISVVRGALHESAIDSTRMLGTGIVVEADAVADLGFHNDAEKSLRSLFD
jgi:hypothetical protein